MGLDNSHRKENQQIGGRDGAVATTHRLTVVAHAAGGGVGHGGDRYRCPKECPEVGASNDERPEVGAADDKEAN